jgi:O-antigen ligase
LLPLLFLNGISDVVLLPRQLLLTAFTAFLSISVLKSSKKDFDSMRLDVAHLAMIVFFLIAAVVSLGNAAVVSESLYFLSKLWILISFSLLTIWLLQKNVITVSQIIKAVIIFGCAAIMTAVADIAGKSMSGEQLLHSIHHISGNFANKNLLSSILFLCLPFFMIGCQGEKRLKFVSCLALFLAILILLVIRTRTVLVATFVFFGIILFFFLRGFLKCKIWWIAAFLLVVAIVGFLQFGLAESIGRLQSSTDIKTQYIYRLFYTGTFKERLLFWQNSFEMLREHPFGVGLGNWQLYFPKYGLGKFGYYEMANGLHTLQRPHNDFLWVLCETGILGFAAFAAVFVIIIYQLLSLVKSAATRYERQSPIYLFSAVIGYIIIAFFDFPMERMEHQIVLMLLFAIVIYQYGLKNSGSFAFPFRKTAMASFVIFGICFSFAIAYRRLESERQVYKLYEARAAGNNDNVLLCAQEAESNFYKIDSKAIPLKWYMGTAYFSKGKFSESEACFKEAYLLTPYNIHAINNLASCYEINGKRNEAIEMYLKALQISPHFEEARLNLAAVYFNNKAYDLAFRTIDSCSVETRDPKYKIFLPPILKSKADEVLKNIDFPVSTEIKSTLVNVQDYSQLYYESKKNNITFEQQIIKYLKNNL